MKRIIALFLLLSLLCACSADTERTAIRYGIPSGVSNLDPQFTTDSYAQNILYNAFEGLLVQLPSGEIVNGVIDDYTLSADGRIYTFSLRQDLRWANEDPLTAQDFVFAFRRLFNPVAVSPFAGNFSGIKNAAAILDGRMDYTALMVTAPDPQTLVIELEQPSPFFLEQLCTPAAYPCNEAFFAESRGRYGLSANTLLCNGPFQVTYWGKQDRITLKRNPAYYDADAVVNTSISAELYVSDAAAAYADGDVDIAAIDPNAAEISRASESVSFANTTWVLIFNEKQPAFADRSLRAAVAASLDLEAVRKQLPADYTVASSLIPSVAALAGMDYRSMAGEPELSLRQEDAKALLKAGLEACELQKLPKITVLIPDSAPHPNYFSVFQQQWQQEISTFLNMQQLPLSDLMARIHSGDYTVAIVPLILSDPNPFSFFSGFTAQSTDNFLGYETELYDSLIVNTESAATATLQATLLLRCEQLLIDDAAMVPLFSQISCYAADPAIGHYAVSPFYNRIYFAMR